jgi:hypothetical protein
MSRSRRRTPKVGLSTAESEKDDKARSHRRGRHAMKQMLVTAADDPDVVPAEPEHPRSGGWTFSKDGKNWIGRRHPKVMRK